MREPHPDDEDPDLRAAPPPPLAGHFRTMASSGALRRVPGL
ncbi:MAG TPA: hypothetical protein VFX98_08295 [Longimicrobiaceae bacterium]|nr:hypothetical protein [Longimicrobiaceae bacterium]